MSALANRSKKRAKNVYLRAMKSPPLHKSGVSSFSANTSNGWSASAMHPFPVKRNCLNPPKRSKDRASKKLPRPVWGDEKALTSNPLFVAIARFRRQSNLAVIVNEPEAHGSTD